MSISVSTAADMNLSELKEVLQNDDSVSPEEPFDVITEEEITELEENLFVDRETMLLLYRGNDFTINELSEILGITPSKVSTILSKYRIYKNMHKYLEASSEKQVNRMFSNDS